LIQSQAKPGRAIRKNIFPTLTANWYNKHMTQDTKIIAEKVEGRADRHDIIGMVGTAGCRGRTRRWSTLKFIDPGETTIEQRREISNRVLSRNESVSNTAYEEAKRLFTSAQMCALHKKIRQQHEDEYYCDLYQAY